MKNLIFIDVIAALRYLFSDKKEFRYEAISLVRDYPLASLFYLLNDFENCNEKERIELILGISLDIKLLLYLKESNFKFTNYEFKLLKNRLIFLQ